MKNYDEVKKAITEIGVIIGKLPENVQQKAFDVLLASFFEKSEVNSKEDSITVNNQNNNITKRKSKKKSGITKESFQLDKNLDLKGNNETPSFRNFVENKKPASSIEFNVVALYYFKKYAKLSKVNINQIYTCYKDVNRKVPGNMQQSIHNTSSSRYGYIDLSSSDDIALPTRGETFVEDDLPKK